MVRSALVVAAVLVAAPLSAQQPYTPARYAAGSPPGLPVLAVGGGQAFVELTVGPDGAVKKVTALRSTPPFTLGLANAVTAWRFSPAMEDALGADGRPQGPKPVASRILVASLFRAPTLLTPTLGEKTVNVGVSLAGGGIPIRHERTALPATGDVWRRGAGRSDR